MVPETTVSCTYIYIYTCTRARYCFLFLQSLCMFFFLLQRFTEGSEQHVSTYEIFRSQVKTWVGLGEGLRPGAMTPALNDKNPAENTLSASTCSSFSDHEPSRETIKGVKDDKGRKMRVRRDDWSHILWPREPHALFNLHLLSFPSLIQSWKKRTEAAFCRCIKNLVHRKYS